LLFLLGVLYIFFKSDKKSFSSVDLISCLVFLILYIRHLCNLVSGDTILADLLNQGNLIFLKVFQVENRFTIRCNSLLSNSEIDVPGKSGK